VKIGFVILYVLFYIKMLYRWFFFTVNSMILIEYGFVIAGSEIREKKEFFLHPLFRFVWVVFLCPDFFIMKMLWSLGQKRWF